MPSCDTSCHERFPWTGYPSGAIGIPMCMPDPVTPTAVPALSKPATSSPIPLLVSLCMVLIFYCLQ